MTLKECNQENLDCGHLYRINGLISLKINCKGKTEMEKKYSRLNKHLKDILTNWILTQANKLYNKTNYERIREIRTLNI